MGELRKPRNRRNNSRSRNIGGEEGTERVGRRGNHLVRHAAAVYGNAAETETRVNQCVVRLTDFVADALILHRICGNSRCDHCLAFGPGNQILRLCLRKFGRIAERENNRVLAPRAHTAHNLLGKRTGPGRSSHHNRGLHRKHRSLQSRELIRILKFRALSRKRTLFRREICHIVKQQPLLIHQIEALSRFFLAESLGDHFLVHAIRNAGTCRSGTEAEIFLIRDFLLVNAHCPKDTREGNNAGALHVVIKDRESVAITL